MNYQRSFERWKETFIKHPVNENASLIMMAFSCELWDDRNRRWFHYCALSIAMWIEMWIEMSWLSIDTRWSASPWFVCLPWETLASSHPSLDALAASFAIHASIKTLINQEWMKTHNHNSRQVLFSKHFEWLSYFFPWPQLSFFIIAQQIRYQHCENKYHNLFFRLTSKNHIVNEI